MKKSVHIIGSGFSALAASCYLAKFGFEVNVFEKNETVGGRARQWNKDGFTFDIGPSWYWMPDVFERFFTDFGKKPSDYYELIKLNPAYRVHFGVNDQITIKDNLNDIITEFETIEKGSGTALQEFIKDAKENYDIAIKDLVYKPGVSALELITPKTIQKLGQFATSIKSTVKQKIKNRKLQQVLEFPVLFLGAKPSDTPAFYNFMNYADFGLGTWYPKGGMYKVVEAMESLALELGVKIHTNSNVEKIIVKNKTAIGIQINKEVLICDIVLSGADYHHSEQLLNIDNRAYSENYWNKKIFAPSSLLFFVGFDKKLNNLYHHELFFDVDFDAHAKDIYDEPQWPKEPLFYASFPSVTDETVAPKNQELGFFLIPLAPGIEDTELLRESYFVKIIERFEKITQQEVKSHILFKKSYCKNDFVTDYNSYKGNAYGMANTLLQTAFLRPKIKSKKVSNLFFTGQLTVPGPGVPPSLISGKLASELIYKNTTK